MNRTLLVVPFAILLAACGELPTAPAASVAAVPSFQAAQAKVAICHVDAGGRVRKISVAEAAVAAHMGHGDSHVNPLAGSWSGSWFADYGATVWSGMTVQFSADDCAGPTAGETFATVDYSPYCSGYWVYLSGSLETGIQAQEYITSNPTSSCVESWSASITYDPDSGVMHMSAPGDTYQFGMLTRAP